MRHFQTIILSATISATPWVSVCRASDEVPSTHQISATEAVGALPEHPSQSDVGSTFAASQMPFKVAAAAARVPDRTRLRSWIICFTAIILVLSSFAEEESGRRRLRIWADSN